MSAILNHITVLTLVNVLKIIHKMSDYHVIKGIGQYIKTK